MNRFLKMLPLAAAGLAGLSLPAEALIIKVTDPQGGSDYAAMGAVVEEARAHLTAGVAAPPQIDGYSVLASEGNALTAAFSLSPGTSSVIWSDKGVRFESGFSFAGGKAQFHSGRTPSAQSLEKQRAPARAPLDRLSTVTLDGSRLALSYSVAAPGPVKVELFSAKGSLVKRWNWTEASAGAQSKSLDVPRLNNGLHFLRWSNGSYRAVHQLAPQQGRTAQ